VVVSTYRRRQYLPELFAALEAQTLPAEEFEVVVVDNGSGDGTWVALAALVEATPLRATAVGLEENRRAAGGRNAGAAHVRAPLLAITDDDCLPTPGWLSGLLAAFGDGADVVQGKVEPEPRQFAAAAPWDHTVWVPAPGPLFETCNVAYRRTAFDRAGGFDEGDPLFAPPTGRAFGEDAHLGWKVVRDGGRRAFAEDALVHHRVVPSTYRARLRDQRHAAGFPGLARRSPLVAEWFRGGVFLSAGSAAFDAAVAGAIATVALRRPWPLLAALPWARLRWRDSLVYTRGDRRRAARMVAEFAGSDLVILASLVQGSIRHRRLVL
jgi:glycosyltransferase involved in cell wall biosynthesis